MTDPPSSSHTTDRNDGEELTDGEPEATFLANRTLDEYPAVLRITSTSEAAHREDALDRIHRWEDGEAVPHVINFQNASDLRGLLTDRRLEILRTIMGDRPPSIRTLARRLERDVKSVHDDLQLLADYDIVHFEEDGRAKRPFVPYDTIEIALEITAAPRGDDQAPA